MSVTVNAGMSVEQIERAITENEVVTFAEGRYCLPSPIRLKGLNNRTLIGEAGVIFCGGSSEYVSWKVYKTGIYQTNVGEDRMIDGLGIADQVYRQARYPHAADHGSVWNGSSADALEFAAACVHPENGYFHAMHAHMWGDEHYRIVGKESDGRLKLEGGWQNNRPMGIHRSYRFVENLFEALGAFGEYFYDRRTGDLFVCAENVPDENVFLIENARLLDVDHCTDISLENLTFADSARTFMEEYEPLLRSDWCIHRGGAVFVQDSAGISVKKCDFHRVGSNALFFSGNVSGCHVERCHISDIGASGICFVGKPTCVRFPCTKVDQKSFSPNDKDGTGPKTDDYARDCEVENCLIHDIGCVEKQTSCVEISMSARIRVAHCTMYGCPRAAVNISEGTFGGHRIEYNDIFDTVRETGDHGSINGWGRDRFWHAEGLDHAQIKALALRDAVETTVLRGNRVRCDHGWDIDLDDGCSNYLVEDNLLLAGGLKFREGFCRTARRNVMINNTFHPHVWFDDSGDVFEENLVMRLYQPIGMPEKWGTRIDNNVFAAAEEQARPAVELRRLSGQDNGSIAVSVVFDENLRPTKPELCSRFPGLETYGVTDEKLKAQASRCPITRPMCAPVWAEGERISVGEGTFKSIETDGEMSAFAAPGHCGVIVLSLPSYGSWYVKGLRENMAIISVNGEAVVDAAHFLRLYDELPQGADVVLQVRTMFNESFEISISK